MIYIYPAQIDSLSFLYFRETLLCKKAVAQPKCLNVPELAGLVDWKSYFIINVIKDIQEGGFLKVSNDFIGWISQINSVMQSSLKMPILCIYYKDMYFFLQCQV